MWLGRAIFEAVVCGCLSFFGGVPVFFLAAWMLRKERGGGKRLQGDFLVAWKNRYRVSWSKGCGVEG